MKKHFTATAYIFQEEKVLLHRHEKIGKWLPPGGHIEPNETPHEAALREAKEECGLTIEILRDDPLTINQSNAVSIPRPWMILLEEIPEHKHTAAHQHIDCIFLAKPVSGQLLKGFYWFSWEQIEQLDEIFDETKQVLQKLLCEKMPSLLPQPARM